MKIEKICIRNFRPIGEQDLELALSTNCSTFIGDNNVGKSSIFEAIKRILEPQIAWDKEDWHAGNQNKIIKIRLEYILDENQIKQIIEILELPLTVTSFKENFTDKLTYEYEYESRKTLILSSLIFKLGELQIGKKGRGGTAWIGELYQNQSHKEVSWNQIIQDFKSQKNKTLIQIIKDLLDINKTSSVPTQIVLNDNIPEDILKILRQSIIVIEEFREKPQKALVDFQTSPTGRELASVLFNLKNGRPQQKEKFEQIRQKFHNLFPILELDVLRENNEIKILIQKAGIESTTFYLGAGILETLLILTHLIAHYDKVLCIDHPELHLHPHAQRGLGSFIEGTKDGQILVITHSPYFVNLNKNSSIIRFVQKEAQTETIEPSKDYFTEEDFFKLEQFLDIDTKELFFARKVILVEGPTELGALPIFASKTGYNFDENGASVINVGGKETFEFFVKLCEGFEIPYFIIADNDASVIVKKINDRYPNCKSYILPGDFDDLLPKELREEAVKFVGKSKPRVGRYVSRKMLKEGMEVPEEIKQIIEQVRSL
ncbi:MAG: DNA replication and repair protein RecF [Candidatus Methanoperedens nitroreducens]|uniref:DNA replication and repair protein RecF n=1 Tax=Candidatus Methanoperedens nitratireducens TaxID=1392998 RepID=A0A0P8E353_9EURY|nr:AAA family ATPase [Candidatus Methanoperedens sp. BLZ2]KAB2940875.1 MAG: AAA family ATPase [Candidatus Methanoperedens sp.]KPQ44836.1 MAG: DNA replication and repair protein RecF [Candidatus Methanoperedens sp. BLZ1]MBZ0177229.1 AAA family ATPase [Candidatus Methanoperedens nitroreducens]MCX9077140.1 AAA family ATPase [Candidatus Methanoperedens sp.]